MKVIAEHYQAIEDALSALNQRLLNENKGGLDAISEGWDLGKDKSMRFRWDAFHTAIRQAGLKVGHAHNGVNLPIYDYANDDHIDTAIKKALRVIMRKDRAAWATR